MSPRQLRMERALDALPEVDELQLLREAMIGGSRTDPARAWAGSDEYATLDMRLVDADALELRIPDLADRVREQTERILRHSVGAVRALRGGDEAAAARQLVAAGEVEEARRRYEQAERFFAKALELGRRPRDRSAEGLALRRLGRVARSTGRLPQALDWYRRGYQVATAMGDGEGAVVACQGLGNVYVDQGLWNDAREWYERALEGVDPEPPSRLLWQCYNNLSVVGLRTGRMAESSTWLDRAEAVLARLNDPQGAVFVANSRGRLHLAQGEAQQAEAAYHRALEAAQDPFARTTVLVNLTQALVPQGRLHEAERTAREAEEVAITHGVVAKLPEVYRTLASVLAERGDGECFLFFEQALDLCRERDLPSIELALVLQAYGAWESRQGMWESGRERLQQAGAIFERLGTLPELEQVRTELALVEQRAQ